MPCERSALGNGWNVVDSFYFAVATLTTSSVADPALVLEDGWMKLFTVFYILIGIGILVEIVRRFGMAFHRGPPRGQGARRGSEVARIAG